MDVVMSSSWQHDSEVLMKNGFLALGVMHSDTTMAVINNFNINRAALNTKRERVSGS